MARTRYQYGTIIIKQGKAHDSYLGRWTEDLVAPGGGVLRKKRAKVLGIVGQITEKQAQRKLEAILSRINDPGYLPESSITFQALAQERHIDLPQVELAWLLARSPAIAVIPGTTHVDHLEDDIGAAKVRLTKKEMDPLA